MCRGFRNFWEKYSTKSIKMQGSAAKLAKKPEILLTSAQLCAIIPPSFPVMPSESPWDRWRRSSGESRLARVPKVQGGCQKAAESLRQKDRAGKQSDIVSASYFRAAEVRQRFLFYFKEEKHNMEGFLNAVKTVNDAVNGAVWGLPGLILLIGTGILLTFGTKVFQISHISFRWRTFPNQW